MHPVCIVTRYVGEILQQAIETDVLVVIAANGGRCVRSTKFCVFVVQHAHTREECEEKLKVLIVEMKAEIVEAQRLKAEGTLPPEEPEKARRKASRKQRSLRKRVNKSITDKGTE